MGLVGVRTGTVRGVSRREGAGLLLLDTKILGQLFLRATRPLAKFSLVRPRPEKKKKIRRAASYSIYISTTSSSSDNVGTRRIKSPAVGDVDACDRVGLVRPPTAMTSRHREASQRSVVPLCPRVASGSTFPRSGHQLRRVAQSCVAARCTTLFQRSVSTKWDRARRDRARLVRPLPRTTNFATSRRGRPPQASSSVTTCRAAQRTPQASSSVATCRVTQRRMATRATRATRAGRGSVTRAAAAARGSSRSQLNNAG